MSNEAEQGPEGRAESSTSTRHAPRSLRDLLSGLPQGDLDAFLDALSPNALMSLPWLFEHWALGHQLPPEGDWTTWVILGGRGAGKTRAGAEWVRAQVEGAQAGRPGGMLPGRPGRRDARPGARGDGVRVVAASSPARRPTGGRSGRRRASGWSGRTGRWRRFSPPAIRRALRGPQFDCGLVRRARQVDEGARTAWDMLQFALRLGEPAAGGGDDDAARQSAAAEAGRGGGHGGDAGADRGEPDASGGRAFSRGDGEVRRHVARAAGARRRVRARRSRARSGAWAMLEAARAPAAGRARPDRGGGRPAGDERRGRRTSAGSSWRAWSRRGPPQDWTGEVIADGSVRGALAAGAGRSGRWRSTTRTTPTGWWRR